MEITFTVKILSCNYHFCKCTDQSTENFLRTLSVSKVSKYSKVTLATRKFRSLLYTSGERTEVDGQEAVLLMTEVFGLCTVTHKKCTADCFSQNREIDLTQTALHIM
jgi:hypothetical protein